MLESRHAGSILLVATIWLVIAGVPAEAAADLKVVATTGDLAAMSRAVLGADGETIQLVRAGEDPHFVDPRPSFARELNDADLVAYVGMDLEVGWLPTLINRSRNSSIRQGQAGHFDASEHIQPRGVPSGDVDRSRGDVHPDGNPHYTLDPRQMARVALAFGRALGELEPELAAQFQDRSRELAREAIRLAQRWEGEFAELSDEARQMIGFHDSWAYVGNWLGIELPIELEPNPGVPPNPRHIGRVIDMIESRNIGVIAQLDYYSTNSAERIADRVDGRVEVLSIPAQTGEDEGYLQHLEEDVIRPIYEAMETR